MALSSWFEYRSLQSCFLGRVGWAPQIMSEVRDIFIGILCNIRVTHHPLPLAPMMFVALISAGSCRSTWLGMPDMALLLDDRSAVPLDSASY